MYDAVKVQSIDELDSLPILSRREWAIMNVCWKQSKLTVQEIIEESPEEDKKHYQTIKAQIDTLVKKGYLTRQKIGPIWLYSPVFLKRKVIVREVKFFLETVTGTNLTNTLIDLIESKSFRSTELIKAMEAVINTKIEEKYENKDKMRKS